MLEIKFDEFIQNIFAGFLEEFGFSLEEIHSSGRYSLARFTGKNLEVSSTCEPAESFIRIVIRHDGECSLDSLDDSSRVLHLSDLNSMFAHSISASERQVSASTFNFQPKDHLSRQLLKSAKELKLVLPRYLKQLEE